MTLRSRVLSLVAAITLVSGTAVLVSSAPAGATTATITVTSTADAAGTCPSTNNCTFLQAVTNANVGGPNQNDDVIISFAANLGTISVSNPIQYGGGTNSSHSLTLDGNGITISALAPIQMFYSGSTGPVSITETTWTNGSHGFSGGTMYVSGPLTITDTAISNSLSAQNGGAVFAANTLEMHRVEFSDNESGGNGAAFYAAGLTTISDAEFSNNESIYGHGGAGMIGGNATLTGVIADGNRAYGDGGAFRSIGDMTVSDAQFGNNVSTASNVGGALVASDIIVSNATFFDNNAGNGGAFFADSAQVSDSVFENNSATQSGGAVYTYGVATIDNSTFNGNAAMNAGAVNAYNAFVVTDSSFVDNSATNLGAALVGNGGMSSIANSTLTGNLAATNYIAIGIPGLSVAASTVVGNVVSASASASTLSAHSGTLRLMSSVLDSSDSSDLLCDSISTVLSFGYNYANDTSCGLTEDGDSQSSVNDPLLGALGDHGGDTLTMLPISNSPLVGAIPNSDCHVGISSALTTDQRGFARPTLTSGPCDIGAVQLAPTVSAMVVNGMLQISVTEFASLVTVTLYSSPTVLGTLSVDSSDSGSASFALPCPIEAGTHTVAATANGSQTASTTVVLDACVAPVVVVPVFAG